MKKRNLALLAFVLWAILATLLMLFVKKKDAPAMIAVGSGIVVAMLYRDLFGGRK
jgi:hypothetical protein